MGMVNALGGSPEEILPRLIAGDQSHFVLHERPDGRKLWLAEVDVELPEIPAPLARFACRNNALSLAALQQIEAAVGEAVARFGPRRVAVVIGSSTSGVADAEVAIRHQQSARVFPPDFHYEQLEFGGAAEFVALAAGAKGPTYALSTACSSGARALASARSLLALGVCDAVIAGATDTLCGLTIGGFSSLQVISPELTNPCSANRRGLTLGEGSTLFLLTREDESSVSLVGVGESSEAHHMSAPDPSGRGASAAMREALADAGASPSEIRYLNLHGTGTSKNDEMECRAVEQVLGTRVPCSSTKALVGHTLGAAGAIEAGFLWLALRAAEHGKLPLPPHRWDGERDPALPEIRLAGPGEFQEDEGRCLAMSNSFGFGGNNCTLVLEAPR